MNTRITNLFNLFFPINKINNPSIIGWKLLEIMAIFVLMKLILFFDKCDQKISSYNCINPTNRKNPPNTILNRINIIENTVLVIKDHSDALKL
jgi:hypothetical protein